MRRSLRAFTLIEILMAMMVLSIGLASVLSVFVAGLRSSREVIDESAAAVAAKAVLARVLSEDTLPATSPPDDVGDGVRDYLDIIAVARGPADEPACDWVWLHDKSAPYSGKIGADSEDDASIPAPVPIAENSRFGWRCRASRHRGVPGTPTEDLQVGGSYVTLTQGRVPASQISNPDADELWRLTIEIYRDYEPGLSPLKSMDTLVCLAHR